ncbi:helix-turn-helix domain-containing protein [Metabacillus elymi]|uniref:Helix-turn-helix domain-containing protein n=1 Tax=Metabacillus elymi TaxID=2745198 RepID=A0ABX6SCV0_9BACI|nr:helix-turn-helix transcriptional regulator [Metabacillus sp. KUDC1714]QNF29651.1 helix-turn-helix domain-containing protein [Metabacillus sp. KUDC1714]
MMIVGKRLRELRVSKGLSLNEVGGAISISTLDKLERGESKNFNCNHLLVLSHFYQVSPMYLLGLDEMTYHIEPKWIVLIKKLKKNNLTPRDVIKCVEKEIDVSMRNRRA